MASQNTQLELTYFNLRGRAGHIRILLHYAKQSYVDHAIEFQDLIKQVSPFGTLPTIKDGDYLISDSGAILYYLGTKFGMAPKDPHQMAQAIMLTNAAEDLRIKYFDAPLTRDGAPAIKEFKEKILARWLPNFEKQLKLNNNGEGYFVGNELSFADITIFDVLDAISNKVAGTFDTTPDLAAFKTRMEQRLNIADLKKSKKWY